MKYNVGFNIKQRYVIETVFRPWITPMWCRREWWPYFFLPSVHVCLMPWRLVTNAAIYVLSFSLGLCCLKQWGRTKGWMICLELRPYWLASKNTWKLKIVVAKQKEALKRHEYVYWFCTWKLNSMVICQFHLLLSPCRRRESNSILRIQDQTINTLHSVCSHISISWFWKRRKDPNSNLIKENGDGSANSEGFHRCFQLTRTF